VLFSCVLCLVSVYCTTKGYIKQARTAISSLETFGGNISIDNKALFEKTLQDLNKAIEKIDKRSRLRFDGPGESTPDKDLLNEIKRVSQALSAVAVYSSTTAQPELEAQPEHKQSELEAQPNNLEVHVTTM
jgi:uncharacterized membrane protein